MLSLCRAHAITASEWRSMHDMRDVKESYTWIKGQEERGEYCE
jgi:hypothetical protein